MVVDTVIKTLEFDKKPRRDSVFDLFSRLVMHRVLLVSAILAALNWYSDKVECMIPEGVKVSAGYTKEACWAQGYFIYRSIGFNSTHRTYGIPTDIRHDGRINGTGALCTVDLTVPECKPMEKTYFKHYQFLHLFLAALCLLFSLPVHLFNWANSDMVKLDEAMRISKYDDVTVEKEEGKEKKKKPKYDYESALYFFITWKGLSKYPPEVSTRRIHRLRIVAIFFVKLLYIGLNVGGFLLTDHFIKGRYITSGSNWESWGNVVLPLSGICEVKEMFLSKGIPIFNKHKMVCEYSQNVLYSFVLFTLWFVYVVGIGISVLGLIGKIISFTWRYTHQHDRAFLLQFNGHGVRAPDEKRKYIPYSLRELLYLSHVEECVEDDVYRHLFLKVYEKKLDETKQDEKLDQRAIRAENWERERHWKEEENVGLLKCQHDQETVEKGQLKAEETF